MNRFLSIAVMATLFSGCSQSAPKEATEIDVTKERSALPSPEGSWNVDGESIRLEGRVLSIGDTEVAREVIGLPSVSADGTRIAFSHGLEGNHGTALSVVEKGADGWSAPRILVAEGTPDRVAISPDGSKIAYVAPAYGIASIWIIPFEGGNPLQLTNVGVRRDGPGRPDGFVPPPHRGPLRFDGDRLVWESPEGTHEAVLP